MSEPTQTCQVCGDFEVVHPDGRGFPPDIAKRRLITRCRAAGHICVPKYRAGMSVDLETVLSVAEAIRDRCTCAERDPSSAPLEGHEPECSLQNTGWLS